MALTNWLADMARQLSGHRKPRRRDRRKMGGGGNFPGKRNCYRQDLF